MSSTEDQSSSYRSRIDLARCSLHEHMVGYTQLYKKIKKLLKTSRAMQLVGSYMVPIYTLYKLTHLTPQVPHPYHRSTCTIPHPSTGVSKASRATLGGEQATCNLYFA